MNITPNIKTADVNKSEMEMVEQEKQEYKLVNQYLRTPGLKLWAYNIQKDKLIEVPISYKSTGTIEFNAEGELSVNGVSAEKAHIDTRDEHFESLNLKNAERRVNKWKDGKISQLSNLRYPNPEGINIF